MLQTRRVAARLSSCAALATAASVAVLGSCSDGGRAPTEFSPRLPEASIQVVAGDSQAGVVNTLLPDPLVFRLVDRAGAPIPGRRLHFTVTDGDGAVESSWSLTDTQGMVQVRWTLGPLVASSHRLRVSTSASTDQGSHAVLVSATARPGPPERLEKLGGDEQGAPLGEPLPEAISVQVLDRYGNGVPGVVVSWSAGGGGRVDPENGGTSDSRGIASARWTLGAEFGALYSATAALDGGSRRTFSAVARLTEGTGAPRIAFIRESEDRVFRVIYSVAADGSDLRRITPADRRVLWYEISPLHGRVAYCLADTPGIWVSTLDGRVLAVLAPQFLGIDMPYLDWSPDGLRIAFQGGGLQGYVYVTEVRDGALPMRLTSLPVDQASPRWSPDGRQIAFVHGSWSAGFVNLMVMHGDGSGLRRIALPTVALNPRWSPDGRQIAFDNWSGVWVVNADGAGARPMTPGCLSDGQCDREIEIAFPQWSPDGRQLAAFTLRRTPLEEYRVDTIVQPGAEAIPVVTLLRQPLNSFPGPQWSLDGRRIAFTSQRDGNVEVHTIAPDGSDRRRITHWEAMDEQPRWFLAPRNR